MAQIKNKLMEEFNASPIKIGEKVSYCETIIVPSPVNKRGKKKTPEQNTKTNTIYGYVVKVEGDDIHIKKEKKFFDDTIVVKKKEEINRAESIYVGVNPIPEHHWLEEIERWNYPLCSLIGILNLKIRDERYISFSKDWIYKDQHIEDINDDPFVIDKDGVKRYYQRGYVWNIEQKKNLIRSIFNHLDCGKIIVRQRNWQWVQNEIDNGNTSARLIEIVDGKQRINALKEYLNDAFDVDGVYYSDLSVYAKRVFEDLQPFSVGAFRENAKDESIIKAFLNVNFTGTQCSQEHIEYVKSINNNM